MSQLFNVVRTIPFASHRLADRWMCGTMSIVLPSFRKLFEIPSLPESERPGKPPIFSKSARGKKNATITIKTPLGTCLGGPLLFQSYDREYTYHRSSDGTHHRCNLTIVLILLPPMPPIQAKYLRVGR